MHYQIARYAPQHPYLFLNTWGKPLFTTLASLPAQLGFYGMVGFNLLVGGATVFYGMRLLPKNSWLGLAWPIWLLSSHLYLHTIIGGLTEPLFGLLVVMALYFAIQQKWKTLAIILGLSFFARPESVVLIPFGGLYFLMHRKWKESLLIAVPFVLVSLIGWPIYKDFFWYLTHQTYTGAADIYGKGPWNHFLINLPQIYGWPLLIGLALLPFVAIVNKIFHRTKTTFANRTYLMLAFLPTIGILLLHSYLWWQGAKGSYGLLRVMATTIPAVVALLFFQFGRLEQVYALATRLFFCVITLGTITITGRHYYETRHTYIQPSHLQSQPKEVGKWLQLHQKNQVVAFLHPLVGFFGNLDPEDTSQTRLIWRLRKQQPYYGLNEGDFLVWDAPHAPNEGNLQLEDLMIHPQFEPVAFFPPIENWITMGDRPLEYYVFQAVPEARKLQTITIQADTFLLQAPEFLGSQEYVHLPIQVALPTDSNYLYCEVTISGAIQHNSTTPIYAVLQQADASGLRLYRIEEILQPSQSNPGWQTFALSGRITPEMAHLPVQIYLWNRANASVTAQNLEVTVKRIFLPPPYVTTTIDAILQPSN